MKWLPLLLLTLAGCAFGPRRVALPPAEAVPAHRGVEVWRDGKAARLHALTYEVDSIRGRPATAAADCDSCRVAIAIGDIDSLRLARDDRGARIATGVPIAALAAVTLIWGMSGVE